MIDNNKLAKELASIYSSSNKARKSVVTELSKIDEKYRKLAEQEKAQLNKTLEMLDAQLKYYGDLLGLENGSENVGNERNDVAEEHVVPVDEEEPVIQDTIFPENNATSAASEFTETEKGMSVEEAVSQMESAGVVELKEEDVTFESSNTTETDQYTDIWPDDNAPKEEEKTEQKVLVDDNDWPAFPDSLEWKN